MTSNHTQFVDIGHGAWAVYRLKTESGSIYLVGLHSIGGRKSAVVRGEPGTPNENVIVRDTDPQIGGRSLFDAPSSEWLGQRLRVATMETSPVASVTQVTDARTVTSVTGAVMLLPSGGTRIAENDSAPAPERTPYPESHVRYAEDAASLLRAVHRRADTLFDDVAGDPRQRARLQVALAGCLLALDSLRGRVTKD